MLAGSKQSLLIPRANPPAWASVCGTGCLSCYQSNCGSQRDPTVFLELEVTSAYLDKELPVWPRALGGVIVHAHGVVHGQLCVSPTDACQGGQFVTQQALPLSLFRPFATRHILVLPCSKACFSSKWEHPVLHILQGWTGMSETAGSGPGDSRHWGYCPSPASA